MRRPSAPAFKSALAAALCIGLSLGAGVFAPVQAAKGDLVIGIGPDIYFDDATITGTERRSVQVNEIDFDYTNDTYFAGELWIATEVIDNLRLGGGIKYLGPYEYIRVEDQEEEEPEVFRLGQLLELTLRVEYLVELTRFDQKMGLDLILGAELGLAMLFPDGNLKREIKDLQEQDVDAWDTPRLGYVVGPQVGMRFKYNNTLAFRFQVAFNWEQLFLFAIDEEVSNVNFELTRKADIIRIHFGLSLEVTL